MKMIRTNRTEGIQTSREQRGTDAHPHQSDRAVLSERATLFACYFLFVVVLSLFACADVMRIYSLNCNQAGVAQEGGSVRFAIGLSSF